MTDLEVLRFAYKGALYNWSKEKERLERNPCGLARTREQIAWTKLEEISERLRMLEEAGA